jgi:hypothetical protein
MQSWLTKACGRQNVLVSNRFRDRVARYTLKSKPYKEPTMRKSVLILFAVFLLAVVFPVLPQEKEQPKSIDISGAWDMVVSTPQGDMPSDATFTQDKETLKVSLTGPQGTIAGEGTIKEGAVQWTITISTPQGDFSLLFKGKVDGDKMSGEVQMGDFGSSTWSATKKKK